MVCMPSEVAVGCLPASKCLQLCVVEINERSTSTGKPLLEVLLTTKIDSPIETFQIEAWGAQAARLKGLLAQLKVYNITSIDIKDASKKGSWSPSLCATFGMFNAKSTVVPVTGDTSDFKIQFPTMAFVDVLAVQGDQQGCFEGVVTKNDHAQHICKGKKPTDPTVSKPLSRCTLQNLNATLALEFWEEAAPLLEGYVAGDGIRVDRGLANNRGNSTVVNASTSAGKNGKVVITTVTKLSAARTQELAGALKDVDVEVSRFVGSSGGGRTGPAKICPLNTVINIIDAQHVRDLVSIYEILWCQADEVRNSSIESDELFYLGCSTCSAKSCVKHEDASKVPCFSLVVNVTDASASAEAKCFTTAAREILGIEDGMVSNPHALLTEAVLHERLRTTFFAFRVRLTKEAARGTRLERNHLEITAAKALPIAFPDPTNFLVVPCSNVPGVPDVVPLSLTSNALGHTLVHGRRFIRVRMLCVLDGEPVLNPAPNNEGIRLTFTAYVLDQIAPVRLRWTSDLAASRHIMQLVDKDCVYVTAAYNKAEDVFQVAGYQRIPSELRDAARKAFMTRVLFAATCHKAPGKEEVEAWSKLTPKKRAKQIEDIADLHGELNSTEIGAHAVS